MTPEDYANSVYLPRRGLFESNKQYSTRCNKLIATAIRAAVKDTLQDAALRVENSYQGLAPKSIVQMLRGLAGGV